MAVPSGGHQFAASAAALGTDLEAFVTYDRRLAEAARALGMPVASPGA